LCLVKEGFMDVASVARTVPDIEADLIAIYPMLVKRLALVMRNATDAQDVAQSAVAQALANRHRFHGGDARAWLYTIGLRIAFNELRRQRPPSLDAVDPPSWAMATEPDLWTALGELDARQRAAILLTVLDGYTHAEVARMFAVRPGTVSSWVSRGRDRLRFLLGGTDD